MKVSKWSCINIISLLSKVIGLFSHNVYYVKYIVIEGLFYVSFSIAITAA